MTDGEDAGGGTGPVGSAEDFDDRVDWFAWLLVNSRNHWWHPDDVADQLAGAGDRGIDAWRAECWAKFMAYEDLIEDFGYVLVGAMRDDDTYHEWNDRCVEAVERRAARYVDASDSLEPEKTQAEIMEEAAERYDPEGDGPDG